MALCLRKNMLSQTATRQVARPRMVAMNASYKVTLNTPSGTQTIECPDDTYILVSGSRSPGGCQLCQPHALGLRRIDYWRNTFVFMYACGHCNAVQQSNAAKLQQPILLHWPSLISLLICSAGRR